MAHLEKLKTGDFLLEKGIIEPQQAICPFCNLEIETNSHMLFTCSFSWGIWMEILNWWGILGVLHKNCGKFCNEWSGLMKGRKWGKLWNLVLGCTIWSLWYTRKKVKFEIPRPRKSYLLVENQNRCMGKRNAGMWGSLPPSE